MKAEEALQIVEQILPPGTITPVQATIFRRCWLDEEYAAIAKELGYGYGYIRDSGAQLWRALSEALREPVKKKNFRALLQQRFSQRSTYVDYPEQLEPPLTTSPLSSSPLTSTALTTSSLTSTVLTTSTALTSTFPEASCIGTPEFPGSPVSLQSQFYVERSTLESKVYSEIHRQGSLIHLKAPHKMGKSSLLIRILNYASNVGYCTAHLDFKQADAAIFTDLNQFLRWFCTTITLQLQLQLKLTDYWDAAAGSKVSSTLYFSRYLLPQIPAPLVLTLNEFDEVLGHPNLCREFLTLLQSWHEAAKQVETLQKLRLILAYTTDVCVPLKLNYSPFNNVGLPIELPEFNASQVQWLAQRYELNWSLTEAQHLMRWVGGHPYLVQLALYHLWTETITLEDVVQQTTIASRIYAPHLQGCLAVLRSNSGLAAVFKQILAASYDTHYDPLMISQLESLGLIKFEQGILQTRCQLYQRYFSVQLSAVA